MNKFEQNLSLLIGQTIRHATFDEAAEVIRIVTLESDQEFVIGYDRSDDDFTLEVTDL